MGRKTWDSIPDKFRPLKNRLNIVITRSAASAPATTQPPDVSQPIRVSSLEQALHFAQAQPLVGRVFVIGGAQIYDAALKLPAAGRVLLTSIQRDFECDTFFQKIDGDGRWRRASVGEHASWTGEKNEVVEAEHEEAGTRYEFQMWERAT